MDLGFSTLVDAPFEDVVERAKASLKDAGFGIVSEINIRNTFKEKLGIEYRDFLILGACNPGLAKRALDEDAAVGLLLPCNVTVVGEEGGVRVTAVDPMIMLQPMGENAALRVVAEDASPRLKQAIEAL